MNILEEYISNTMFRRLTLFFLLGLTSCGISSVPAPSAIVKTNAVVQSSPPPTKNDDSVPATTTLDDIDVSDPWSIQIAIDHEESVDVRSIWKRLGLDNSFNGLSEWKQPKDFLSTCNFCDADLHQFDLDGEPGDEVLLEVSNTREESRHLLFKRISDSKRAYRLIGSIDHSFGRYEMPDHYFIVGGGRSFIAVKVQTQSGTGVAMYIDRLFTIVSGQLVELNVFPHRGHQNMYWDGLAISRTFSGKITDIRRVRNSYIIEIGLTVSYDTWIDSNVTLWTKKQKATFRWSPGQKQAVFVPSMSTVSNHELERVYDVDTMSDGDFERYNGTEIREYLRHNRLPNP